MNAIFSIFESCNCISKKKLIAIFGAIIIIAITFLYFESFYNVKHLKQNIENSFTATTSKSDSNLNINKNELSKTDNKSKKFEDLLEKSILNDNKNNDNVQKCWSVEAFEIIEPCSRCDSLSRSSLYACKLTGYREILNCEKYGHVSRSCPIPVNVLKKHYWIFEIISLSIGLVFTFISKRRKRYLDHLATERVRKQILSGN